jgi:hypothetical protein
MVAVAVTAWPFLIGRGRRAGYRLLLAPAPLLEAGEQSLLEGAVAPGDRLDEPQMLTVTTRRGQPLTVVHATRRVTGADLARAGGPPDAGRVEDEPTDEHGRPLLLLYGYVVPQSRPATASREDLARALDLALATYVHFLADERAFAAVAAMPLPSRDAPVSPRPVAPQHVAPQHVAPRPVAPPLPVALPRRTEPPTPARRWIGLTAAAVAVVAVLCLVVVLVVRTGSTGPPPSSCASATSTAGDVLSPGAKGTCLTSSPTSTAAAGNGPG